MYTNYCGRTCFCLPIMHDAQVSPPEYLGCFIDDRRDRILTLAFSASDDMTPTVRENISGSAAVRTVAPGRIGVFCPVVFKENGEEQQ